MSHAKDSSIIISDIRNINAIDSVKFLGTSNLNTEGFIHDPYGM